MGICTRFTSDTRVVILNGTTGEQIAEVLQFDDMKWYMFITGTSALDEETLSRMHARMSLLNGWSEEDQKEIDDGVPVNPSITEGLPVWGGGDLPPDSTHEFNPSFNGYDEDGNPMFAV